MRARGEDGAVLILTTLAMLAILGLVALVVDVGALRYDRHADRAAADAAATAGASVLTGKSGTELTACEAAWGYALVNLGVAAVAPPSPCGGTFPTTGLCDPGRELVAAGSAGGYQITITTPVLDTDADLMGADAIAGSLAQPIRQVNDGAPCDRLAVRIVYDRPSFFAGVFGMDRARTAIHSVAKFSVLGGSSSIYPGLIALEPHGCSAIAGTPAQIISRSDGVRPGVMVADSDGSTCGGGAVFQVQGSGSITAEAAPSGADGELQYVASAATAFSGGSISGARLFRPAPLTRLPVDSRYHCSATPEGCFLGQVDPLADIMARYDSGPPRFPGPSSTFPSGLGSCSAPPSVFPAGDWFINCPTFNVNGTIQFGGGTIVFGGDIAIGAGGTLLVNAAAVGSSLPLPLMPTLESVVVTRGSIHLQSANAAVGMSQTMLYQSGAGSGLDLQASPTVSWSSPDAGPLRGLMAWNESGAPWTLQGNPTFIGRGTLFLPNSEFHAQGTGDLNGVQLWARTATAQGASSRLSVRPDSNYAIPASGIGSQLVR